MWVSVGPVWASVARADEGEEAWLADFLSFDDKGAQQAEAIRRRAWEREARLCRERDQEPPPFVQPAWDGKHRLYNAYRRRFPSGLLTSVQRAAELRGLRVEVYDQRTPAPQLRPDTSWLRPYQREALEACLSRVRGVVKSPTGSGKTVIIAALVASGDCRWLVAAPQIDLLDQTARQIERFTGERCGKVGDGTWAPARVTVATLQTLAERQGTAEGRELLEGVGGLVVDEAHVGGAASYYKVMMACQATYRLGFSGTPFARGDGRNVYVMAALGPKIYEIKAPELIEAGVLSKPTIRMFPLRQQLPAGLSWQQVYQKGIVESEARNSAVVALARAADKPCVVFVKEIDHGKRLLRTLRQHLRAGFVWGDTDAEGRRSAIKSLVRGEYEVLVSSTIFEQGVDIEELRSIVVASGGKSAIRAVQRLGRTMRVAEGKRACQLWDFDDMGQVWLDRHSAGRMSAYLKEGHGVVKVDPAEAKLTLRKYGVEG